MSISLTNPQVPIHMVQAIASDIMSELGAGYSESIYRNALWKELIVLDPKTVMEQTVPIVFRGQYLGICRADLVTTDYVIEIKALKTVLPCVGHQIKKYIKHLSEVQPMLIRTGLVINFNQHTETVDFFIFPPPTSPEPPTLQVQPKKSIVSSSENSGSGTSTTTEFEDDMDEAQKEALIIFLKKCESI